MGKQGEFKLAFLDGFWLKLLAFVFMTVDHLGVFLQMYGLAPEAAAKQIVRAIRRGRREVLVGRGELVMTYIKRFFPGLCARLSRRIKPM